PGSPDAPATAPTTGLVDVGVPDSPAGYKPAMSMQVAAFLHNPQTDIFTQEAFFYFLEREFKRAFRFSTEFTLVVFCIRLAAADSPTGLSKEEIRQVTGAINRIKREVDIIGHLGERGFGLILPGVNSAQAANLIDRIMSELPQQAQGLAAYQPALHFGLATVPFDSKELADLLSAAQGAMIVACQKNATRLTASEARA
ncbi:MAG: diguanylate cyclase, partial [Cyanobacteria bacterium HKST-UBA02]|nr:diguanylate cyclase [Cyanobacteria bacterium HKST-UBA02]